MTTWGGDGRGIGLAAMRRIAVVLGGALTVTSKPGVGSTFTLSLPAVTETLVSA